VYPVTDGRELKVGRDPGLCDLCLTEPRVSGLHAAVKFEQGQLFVKDEGSNNGTYLNGGKIQSHVWQPVPAGAALRFGPVEFAVRIE
jgi:pSer/pThr/pTyr-binding forkhead associated (FHA) protein